jgi:hypothetical protein
MRVLSHRNNDHDLGLLGNGGIRVERLYIAPNTRITGQTQRETLVKR